MVRVFIAVDIEDPIVVGRLARLRDSIAHTGVPMKTVEDENFHITLRFIGEVSEPVAAEIGERLASIRFERFRIELRGLGAFPRPDRPRVVWVGVGGGAGELRRIRDEVERILTSMGFSPEKQEFHPHVTLARIKGARNLPALVKLLREMGDVEVGSVEVSSIRLKQSILTRQGPIYKTLYEVKAASSGRV
ncbi:RNA 2',3'-cyclic phosphodiesterase [Aeropyrum pernix]|uniref:RNA 2',3'-cyclic phosphodiesterase n=1 Tax=Aeropyrum pernix TaxID=56636 RepID=UPI000AE5FBE6|nr:RNA 2',3'-cyclic phosphodiesterase [Aeropyrum pernix]